LILARELQNNVLIAQVLRIQSEALLYRGDVAEAAKVASQAAQAAGRASDRSLRLSTDAQVARVAAVAQPSRAVASSLATISREANSNGFIYLSVLTALESAETLIRLGDHQGARQEIDRTLPRAESFGLRELLARSEYVLAATLRAAKNDQARHHYTTAMRILDEMTREDGSEQILQRVDLKAIHAECVRWSRAS
jgi:hypothetical protein